MPIEQPDTIQIPNAKWWEPHSHVVMKEDYLAEDEAWVANQLAKIVNPKGKKDAEVQQNLGIAKILIVKRMVTSGVVAVKRSGGRIKTVSLPHETEKLLAQDLDYINDEIDKLNAPMDEEEQEDFLPGANGHVEESLITTK